MTKLQTAERSADVAFVQGAIDGVPDGCEPETYSPPTPQRATTAEENPSQETRKTSLDSMFRGRVQLEQHRRGYRFSVDAVLLAHYAAQYKPCSALDIGTGCGVIPLLLADLWAERQEHTPQMWGLECQPSLYALAEANTNANKRSQQLQIVHADAREWRWPLPPNDKPRLVTCNPPFFRVGSGRMSPNVERAHARHEYVGSLEDLVTSASQLLHPRGRLSLVYPAPGCQRLMAALLAAKLHTTQLQCVHPYQDAEASLILITARHRASPMIFSAPLILYQRTQPRTNTEQFDTILSGL